MRRAPQSGILAAARRTTCLALLVAMWAGGTGCSESGDPAAQASRQRSDPRPNVLWIVWDTVRADRMSLYGHDRPTTPNLDAWADGARVFDDALSVAGYTLPSHASMFTGMLPGRHCVNNDNKRLPKELTTIAELLSEAGYETFLFSANPNVSRSRRLTQGFDVALHPWSEAYRAEAVRIVTAKTPAQDRSSELTAKTRAAAAGRAALVPWNIKAAGEIAEPALMGWLRDRDPERPFFAFLNYMEAHRPIIPTREARERVMTAEQAERSYQVDRAWIPMWEYTFGLRDYSDEELELTRATYDATLTELDDHFGRLMASLGAEGYLENTVVILTSDHGEHLGEQHMLDHQYSLYQPLLRIPLVVHYPARFAPGRDSNPVMNFDVFSTLLELTGVAGPAAQTTESVSLLRPDDERLRLAEDPSGSTSGMQEILNLHPDWDPSPWDRRQRAIFDTEYKYLWSSRGDHRLFHLSDDAGETRDLLESDPHHRPIAERLQASLDTQFDPLTSCVEASRPGAGPSAQECELLKALGYVAEDEECTE